MVKIYIKNLYEKILRNILKKNFKIVNHFVPEQFILQFLANIIMFFISKEEKIERVDIFQKCIQKLHLHYECIFKR